MPTPLYPFQTDVVERATSDFKKMRAEKEQTGNSSALLISMPCGMGKTVVLSAFIRETLSQSVTLVLTPGKGNLAEQTYSVLGRELADTPLSVILIGEGVPPPEAPRPGTVIVTNYEKVVVKDRKSGEYKSRISREGELVNLWDTISHVRGAGVELVVAIDEAHYGSHGSRGRIGEFFNDIHAKYGDIPLRVETTATPSAKTRTVDVYVVESKPWEGVKAGLLRERVVLNLGRADQESGIRADFVKQGNPEWANSADIVMAEMMHRQWVQVSSLIREGEPHNAYNPLMLFCISNATHGESELRLIEAYLASKDITRANGKLAVHLSDDTLTLDEKVALTSPTSPVAALVFKQSIALGWDCPRAQFMLVTRKLSDTPTTFTEQLLGRIRRQVYGRKRGDIAIDSAYVYAMCEPTAIVQSSGILPDTSEATAQADPDAWKLWQDAGVRKTITTRTGRSGGVSSNGVRVSDPLSRADVFEILDGITPKGALVSVSREYVMDAIGEQEINETSSIVANMTLKDAYHILLRERLSGVVKESFSEAGVRAKGKTAEIAVEPILAWAERTCSIKRRDAESSLLSDIENKPYDGVTSAMLRDLGLKLAARESSIVRNDYVESLPRPYAPVQVRYRPSDSAAAEQGVSLRRISGVLAGTSLYGAVSKGVNTAAENAFEDDFLTYASKRGAVVSWFRNDAALDSYGAAFSLGYRKGNGASSASQMFPDYMVLMKRTDGTYLPVAFEVKGTDKGRPVDGSSDGSIEDKARRLAELSSDDDTAFGNREDTVGADGAVIAYGRGTAIGALVYRDKGAWRVHGQGAAEELSVWLRRHDVVL